MLSLFSSNKAEAQVVLEFHNDETIKNFLAIQDFDDTTNQRIARDVYKAYVQIDRVEDNIAKEQLLADLIIFAQQVRQQALQMGEKSRNNVKWNVSSCIESIAHVELLNLKGLDEKGIAEEVRSRFKSLTNNYLLPEVIEKIERVV